MLPHPHSRLRMAEIIGSKLNISKEKVRQVSVMFKGRETLTGSSSVSNTAVTGVVVTWWPASVCPQAQHFCQMYQPGISLTELEASVGRVTLGRKQTEAVQLSV